MEIVLKILFFSFVIILGFVPGGIFISFILLVLYYLPQILKSYQDDSEDKVILVVKDAVNGESEEMKSYSTDTLEDMK